MSDDDGWGRRWIIKGSDPASCPNYERLYKLPGGGRMPKPKRKPRPETVAKRALKAGLPVKSYTTADGVTINLGEPVKSAATVTPLEQ